jgi:CrcB protein
VSIALAVGGAGAIGAVARYLVDGVVQDRSSGVLPYGTLTVNVVGSLVLGLVTGLALYHGLAVAPRAVIGSGFCGGLTTWSSASWETVRLGEDGSWAAAAGNALGGPAASIVVAALGLVLMAAV